MDTAKDQFPAHGVLISQQSNASPPAVSYVTKRGKGARTSKPKRSGTNNGLSAASSHEDTIEIINDSDCIEDSDEEDDDADDEFVPLSASTSEDEADEDDAVSLGSVSADDDADRFQSALRVALYEAPEKMIANPASQSEVEDRLLDAVAQFCAFLCAEPYHEVVAHRLVLFDLALWHMCLSTFHLVCLFYSGISVNTVSLPPFESC